MRRGKSPETKISKGVEPRNGGFFRLIFLVRKGRRTMKKRKSG